MQGSSRSFRASRGERNSALSAVSTDAREPREHQSGDASHGSQGILHGDEIRRRSHAASQRRRKISLLFEKVNRKFSFLITNK